MSIVKLPFSSASPAILPGDANETATFLEKPDKPLWYLAYGSNLNSEVFKGRRGIKPLEQRNVLVQGLELTFDLAGVPYLEPRFANCRFATSQSSFGLKEKNGRSALDHLDLNGPWTGKGALIGIAYLVTAEDFSRILATEGGGAAYKMVAVDGQVLKSGQDIPNIHLTGEVVRAFTLLAPPEKARKSLGQASPRYLGLIRSGAEEHALPSNYLRYLSELTPYTPTTIRQKAGRAISIATCAPVMILIYFMGTIFSRPDGTEPQWLLDAKLRIFSTIWSTYDGFMKKWFGDGEVTLGSDGVLV